MKKFEEEEERSIEDLLEQAQLSEHITSRRINKPLWEAIKQAYEERPTIDNIIKRTKVGQRMAMRAVNKGWADLGFPPLGESKKTRRKSRAELDDFEEAHRKLLAKLPDDTEKNLATKIAISTTLKIARINHIAVTKALEKAQSGEDVVGEITPQSISQLTKAAADVTNALRRTLEVEKLQAGESDDEYWRVVGPMLDSCNLQELQMIHRLGRLPMRVLDHRATLSAVLSDDEPIDVEYTEHGRGNGAAEARMEVPEEETEETSGGPEEGG